MKSRELTKIAKQNLKEQGKEISAITITQEIARLKNIEKEELKKMKTNVDAKILNDMVEKFTGMKRDILQKAYEKMRKEDPNEDMSWQEFSGDLPWVNED